MQPEKFRSFHGLLLFSGQCWVSFGGVSGQFQRTGGSSGAVSDLFRVSFGLFWDAEQFVGIKFHRNPVEFRIVILGRFRIVPGRFRIVSGRIWAASGQSRGSFRANWARCRQFEMQVENRQKPSKFHQNQHIRLKNEELACLKGIQGPNIAQMSLTWSHPLQRFRGNINHDKHQILYGPSNKCTSAFAMFARLLQGLCSWPFLATTIRVSLFVC